MTALETELIKSAGGDFTALLLILFALLACSIIVLLLKFVINKLPAEMKADRDAMCEQMKIHNEQSTKQIEASNRQISSLISTFNDFTKTFSEKIDKQQDTYVEKLKEHDIQAKKILETNQNIKIILEQRPCIKQN